MRDYEVLCTAVSERADLFTETMQSLLDNVDQQPCRLIVHEDCRRSAPPGSVAPFHPVEPGVIGAWLAQMKTTGKIADYEHRVRDPGAGMGPAMLWCFQKARTPVVYYTQEDWLHVRRVPVSRALEVLDTHQLNHVRFNKRKTMRAKHADTAHPWNKVEVRFAMPDGVEHTWCVSDHFYTQASLWRVSAVLDIMTEVAAKAPQANAFAGALNHRLNQKFVGENQSLYQDQSTRHARVKTYIWGPVAEPAFVKHLGSARTTGPIEHLPGA